MLRQDNVIIGLGPTGLAFALEAVRKDTKKRKVVIISDRQDFTRNAIFRLDVDIFPYLEELVGKEKIKELFDKNLIGPKESLNGFDFHVIQIKVFEKLLFDQLLKYKNVEIIYLPKRGTGKINEIDESTHQVKLLVETGQNVEERDIKFKFLIAADGASHSIANKIGNIEYHHTQHPQVYNKHARVTYKLPSDICADKFRELLQQGNHNKPGFEVLQAKGWNLSSDPEIRIFAIDQYLFIAAECPSQIFGASNEVIDLWIRTVLNFKCEQSTVEQLERVDSGIFEVDLMEADCALRPMVAPDAGEHEVVGELCPSDKCTAYFLQAGDALRTTHYQTGSGAVVGLREAKAFGELMASPQSVLDIVDYHAKIAVIRAENRNRVDAFIDKRMSREIDHGDFCGELKNVDLSVSPPKGGVVASRMRGVLSSANIFTGVKVGASLYAPDAELTQSEQLYLHNLINAKP